MVVDPVLQLSHVEEIKVTGENSKDEEPKMPKFVDIISNFQSTVLLTDDGFVYQINHKHS